MPNNKSRKQITGQTTTWLPLHSENPWFLWKSNKTGDRVLTRSRPGVQHLSRQKMFIVWLVPLQPCHNGSFHHCVTSDDSQTHTNNTNYNFICCHRSHPEGYQTSFIGTRTIHSFYGIWASTCLSPVFLVSQPMTSQSKHDKTLCHVSRQI